MAIKHWIQVGGAVAYLGLNGVSHAAPWLEAGDAQARFALQKLADRGHLGRPATTWPFSWSAVDGGLERSVSGDLAAVGMPRAYLQFERGQQGRPGFRAELSLSVQSEEPAFSGFEGVVGGEGGAGLSMQWQGYALAAGLEVSQVLDPADDDELRFDGSYIAAKVSNWELGAGAIERWWGPGW
uniref:capsule assembly Wzi family protein n=1 Tax=Spongiibacter sp. TaxID=2024860 RepID=UPI003562BEAE